jgi:hypothetical protein
LNVCGGGIVGVDGNLRGANGLGVGTPHAGPLMPGNGSFAGSSTGCERAASNPPPPRVADLEVSASQAPFGSPERAENSATRAERRCRVRPRGGTSIQRDGGVRGQRSCAQRRARHPIQPRFRSQVPAGRRQHSHCDVSLTRVGIVAAWPQAADETNERRGTGVGCESDGGAGIKKPARRGPAGALRPIAFRHYTIL